MTGLEFRKLIKKVAKAHGVSPEEVKREIQVAIDSVYENPNEAASVIPRKGDVPTIEEFIEYFVKRIPKDEQE